MPIGDQEQITRGQHFVPQFYLRRFTNPKNEVEILDCKDRKILTPRGTKGICYEDFFYGIRTGEPDELSQQIESRFQQMEDYISKNIGFVIDKILNGEKVLDDDKWLVAFLMSMLWIRGPVMREQINKMSESVYKRVNAFWFSHPKVDELFDRFDVEKGTTTSPEMREKVKKMITEESYSLEFSNAQHMMMFDNFKGFANLFWGQDWTVYITKGKRKFITSDNPIVVMFPKRQGFYGPTFLERTHYFALTPEIMIMARYPLNDSGKKFHRKTLFDDSQSEVLRLNMIVSGQAYKQAYSNNRRDLEDVISTVGTLEQFLETPEGKKTYQELNGKT